MTTWTWAEDGKSLTFGDRRYDVLPAAEEDVAKYAVRWERARSILERLRMADEAFATGDADYRNAVARMEALYDEMPLAEKRLIDAARAIGSFFQPTDVADRFGQDGVSLRTFIDETLVRLGGKVVKEA
jgi:hypothetical protein